MNKKFLKKIIAHSPEDLKLISACCSEGKVKISEIKYLPKNKIFLLCIDRLVKEEENNKGRVNSIIKFEYVHSSKSKNINQKNMDLTIELVSIDLFKKDQNYEIILFFSNNGFITLNSEIIDVVLEDQKNTYD
ncbi:MAG: DUF2948 family protein [Candidatus Pelagibacter sp.]|tara:strand:- start:310 stop:708 length:399 start_codon:yes stop_codon:yes gene_type:complete